MAQKIIDNLSPVDRKEVQNIALGINEAFFKANEHAGKAIEKYIEVGALLNDARQFFKGDLEFGQWRAENTTLSKSWTTKLLRVYKTYGTTPPKELPFSTLAELAGGSDELKEKVIEQAKDPDQKTPSVREVRAAVKEEKELPPSLSEQLENDTVGKDKPVKEDSIPTLDPTEIAQIKIDKSTPDRIDDWNASKQHHGDALILLGLPPFFDGLPNRMSIEMLADTMDVRNGTDSLFAGAASIIINELELE